jgi:N-acetylglutamate synthase-like GNAT family acetyltransferase
MKIQIREAERKDIPSLKLLLESVDREFVPPLSKREPIDKTAKRLVLGKNLHCLIAASDSVIGSVSYHRPWKGRKDIAFIEKLIVRPDVRGRGLSLKLLSALMAKLEREGAKEAYSSTWSANKRVLHINKKVGLRVHKVIKDGHGPGIDTVLFRKRLVK